MEIAVSMSARRRELAAGGGRPAVGREGTVAVHATMDKIGTELRLHMRRTTTTLALHKEVEVDGPWTAVDIVSNIRHVDHTSVGHAAAAVALLWLAKLYRTEKRMKMEVTNLTWEIPWIILVDVQLPDELNGKRLLLDFPSKVESDELFIRWMKPEASELCGTIPKTSETSKFQHGVLEWSFELVTDLVSQAYLPLSSTAAA
uniref:Uncharacterized protein n=1 Tax=Oryza nivara TaxID=4536 RepID=A0A0E0HL98_ORYNI